MVRKMAGSGLPRGSSSAECTTAKRGGQPEPAHHGVDEPTRRGGRQTQPGAPTVAEVEGVDGTGLELDGRLEASGHGIDDLGRHGLARGAAPGIAGVPVLDGVAEEHPLGLEAPLDGEGHTVAAEDLDLDVVPDGLAVDEQAVHVEDGRLDRHRELTVS